MTPANLTPPPEVPVLQCPACNRPLGLYLSPGKLRLGNAIVERRMLITCAHCQTETIWRPSHSKPG
jgi:RNase P subunit RPR2